MGLKYAAIHMSIHFLTPVAIAYFFNLNIFQFMVALVGALIIDSDHYFLVTVHGVKGAFSRVILHGFGKIRKYPLHNFVTIVVAALGGLLVFQPAFFLVGIFSLAVFIHLLWDLLEDVVIFRVNLNHWKV